MYSYMMTLYMRAWAYSTTQYVTGFAKTIPIDTTIEIQFLA